MKNQTSFLSLFEGQFGTASRPTRMGQLAIRLGGELTVYSRTSAKNTAEHRPHIRFVPFRPTERPLLSKVQRRADLALRRFDAVRRNDAQWAVPPGPLQEEPFDIILCHDLILLPMAYAVRELPHNRGRAKIVMDLREYYPRQVESSLRWKLSTGILYHLLCDCYLRHADTLLTVSPGLVDEYKRVYGVTCRLLPSYSPFHDLQPSAIAEDPIRCIHHGGAQPNRKLEGMIEAVRMLNGRFTLDFMLALGDAAYLRQLQEMARDVPWVRFLPPVPMPDIVTAIHSYHLGLYLISPISFNHRHCWPNKLFEFIQARLGVIVSPVPDMAGLVRGWGVGAVSDDFTPESLARLLDGLAPETIRRFKEHSHMAAKELCWEHNEKVLEGIFNNLLTQ
ncbi:MAG: hypothetical protein IJA79_08800 [Desulfovibrio sp.]|nr:hypothetical protein [Desulfovibrio sp.]